MIFSKLRRSRLSPPEPVAARGLVSGGDSFKLSFLRGWHRGGPGMVLGEYPPSANEVILRMMALSIV